METSWYVGSREKRGGCETLGEEAFSGITRRCSLELFFFFSSRRRHTRWTGDWSSDVCSSDLPAGHRGERRLHVAPEHAVANRRRHRACAIAQLQRARRRYGALRSHCRGERADRKSTRLNSSHPSISYAVFCLKKKKLTPS